MKKLNFKHFTQDKSHIAAPARWIQLVKEKAFECVHQQVHDITATSKTRVDLTLIRLHLTRVFRQLNVLLKIILLHTVCDTVSVARPDTAQEADSNKEIYDTLWCDMNDNGLRSTGLWTPVDTAGRVLTENDSEVKVLIKILTLSPS